MRILGIDYGEARTGFAITDELGITAQGLETIHSQGNDKIILKKIDELLETIDTLTVVELAELVKGIEEKYGVSAAAVAAPVAGGAAAAEEKTEFDVELTEVGSEKIKVIKVVREVTGLGLKEAKELVDGAPKVLKEQASKEEADSIKAKLEEVGAKVTLK